MEENKKKKNKGVIIAIVILILLVLGLGGYIFYDKVLKEEPKEVEVEENVEQENTIKEEVKIEENTIKEEVKVESSFKKSITEDFKNDCHEAPNRTISIDIPRITSDKENAVKINNEIQEKMEKRFGNLLSDFENESKKIAHANAKYEYIIKNNIIYIYIKNSYSKVGCASGYTDRINYFYDINSDKVLSLQEGFESLGYNLDSLKEYGITSYEECEIGASENGCGCGIEITDSGEIKPFFYQQCI